MRTIDRNQTYRLIDAALDNQVRGATIHLPGSGVGRFIVGGVATSIRLPMHQVRHPATVQFITDKVNQQLADNTTAETVGSWRDEFTGDVYIDLGTTHDKRDDAIRTAHDRGERAVYDSTAETVEWV